MKIMFSSRFVKLTFEAGEEFSGRSLRMAGEPLSNGFDADENSMAWLPPYEHEKIDEKTKKVIKQLINNRNKTNSFTVLFMGNDNAALPY